MVTRMEFHARSITIFDTAANCSFFFTYSRIVRSLCKNDGNSCGEAYQRERQSRFTPRRKPIGLTFCPISQYNKFTSSISLALSSLSAFSLQLSVLPRPSCQQLSSPLFLRPCVSLSWSRVSQS